MLGLKSYGLTDFVTLPANRVKEAEHDVEHILETNIGKSVNVDEKEKKKTNELLFLANLSASPYI